jgi:DNA end-binding protein Ku
MSPRAMHRAPEPEEAQEEGAQESARPFWSGTLTFGLVSVPVNLYSAVRSRRTSLRMLDEDGTPLSRRFFDPDTGKEVPWEELTRGWETDSGKYVVVSDDELEALAPEKTRDIDLRRFVPVEQLDPLYFNRTYYLTPGGESSKAYRLLAATMEKTGRAGLATFVMRGTEYLCAILADRGILRAEIMRFQDEVRTPEDVGLAKPRKASDTTTKRMIKAIRALEGESLTKKDLADVYAEKLEALVEKKRKRGKDVVEVEGAAEPGEPSDGKVIDLLDVLRRSMKGEDVGKTARPRRASAKKAPRRTARATAARPRARKSASKRSRSSAKKRTTRKAI